MEISAVGSTQSTDLSQLVQQINQSQIEQIKKMLQVQSEIEVGAAKMQQAEEAQGSVDYYA